MDMPQVYQMHNMQDSSDNKTSDLKTAVIITSIFVLLWIVVGIAAFIMSLVCFGRSGTTAQHIIGLLLSIFFGPFYWVYYFAVSSYCRKAGGKKTFRK